MPDKKRPGTTLETEQVLAQARPPRRVSDAPNSSEQQAREELAALYHMLDRLEMTDLIHTHISMRVPDEPDHMLLNEFGYQFDEITASNLLKVDFAGQFVDPSARSDGRVCNPSAATFHGGCYLNRPEISCVIHTHTVSGIAVSTMRSGLLPLNQHALVVHDELGYLDYNGLGANDSAERVSESTQGKLCFVMKNHGLLALGETPAAALQRIYYLETACKIQCATLAASDDFNEISPEILDSVAATHRKRRAGDYGQTQWDSMVRMLERTGSNYHL